MPRVSLYGRLEYRVDVLTRLVETFVPPSNLDRTQGSTNQRYGSQSQVFLLERVQLCGWRRVKFLVFDLD